MNESLLFMLALLAACTLTMRHVSGSWTAPGALFAAYWFAICVIDSLLGPQHTWTWAPALWLSCAVISFSAGSFLTRAGRPAEVSDADVPDVALPFLQTGIVLCIFGGAVAIAKTVAWGGFSIRDLGSVEGLAAVASGLTVLRYSGENPPVSTSAWLTAIYLGALLGGALAAMPGPGGLRRMLFSASSLVPGLALAIATTAKAGVLQSAVMWLAAYLATKAALQQKFGLTRILLTGAGAAVVVVPVFFALLAWRYGFGKTEVDVLVETTQVALFGPLAAFFTWFEDSWTDIEPAYGVMSFAGVATLLGMTVRVGGVYARAVQLGGSETNIYTGMRSLIEDGGVAGSLVVLFVLGYAVSALHGRARHLMLVSVPLLALFYDVVLWSSIVTATVYTSVCLAHVLFGIYWVFCVKTTREQWAARSPSGNSGLA
jgi:oligosaccharide repeat unit polymerase